MELIVGTGMRPAYTLGVDSSGREHLVVVTKGTFLIPGPRETARLAAEQVPLVEADTFTGEPGRSAPIYEADFALRKPRCDVLLLGSAYVPDRKPAERIQVGLKLGSITKTFNVVGDRLWQVGNSIRPGSHIRPFEQMPISYDRAFGGTDDFHPDFGRHSDFMLNPIGRGYHAELDRSQVDGTPMPNTEEIKRPVRMPDADYAPMSFGPVGRGWTPRIKLAGTYDQTWLDHEFPFLPTDFSDAWFQSAPTDQQIPYPVGGEEVFLLNLTPQGRTGFRLPDLHLNVTAFLKNGRHREIKAVADTIVLEPDRGTFSVTWRANIPLARNIFEIVQVLVGDMPRGWWRARESGKVYYPSLRHLLARRREEHAEGNSP